MFLINPAATVRKMMPLIICFPFIILTAGSCGSVNEKKMPIVHVHVICVCTYIKMGDVLETPNVIYKRNILHFLEEKLNIIKLHPIWPLLLHIQITFIY